MQRIINKLRVTIHKEKCSLIFPRGIRMVISVHILPGNFLDLCYLSQHIFVFFFPFVVVWEFSKYFSFTIITILCKN